MKIRLLSAALICALVALPATRAQDKDQTPMGAKMEAASKAWKAAQKSVKEGDLSKKDDILAKLATVKENLEGTLKFEPATTASKPDAEKAKYVADFRDKMKQEIANVDKLMAAVKAGDVEGAKALVADVNTTQKEGHKAFKAPPKKN
jgi:soluble cytochrome b562